MSVVNDTVQAVLKKVVELAPEALLPGQRPDPIIGTEHKYVGQPIPRLNGPLKVAGRAPCAAERTFDNMLHASIACSTNRFTISALIQRHAVKRLIVTSDV